MYAPTKPSQSIHIIMTIGMVCLIALSLEILVYGVVHESAHACAGMMCGVMPEKFSFFLGINDHGKMALPTVGWGDQMVEHWKLQVILIAPYVVDVVLATAILLWMMRRVSWDAPRAPWKSTVFHVLYAIPVIDIVGNLVQMNDRGNDFYRVGIVAGSSLGALVVAGLSVVAVRWWRWYRYERGLMYSLTTDGAVTLHRSIDTTWR